MRKHLYTLLALFTFVLTSCESYLVNGDLDGFWQVTSIENKLSGETTQCKGNIYYSFQRDLVLVSYVSPTMPAGQTKENYIAYFSYMNDSITMGDFRIYLDIDGEQAPLERLEKFGLHDVYSTFQVEKLNKKSMILNSKDSRIVFRKY